MWLYGGKASTAGTYSSATPSTGPVGCAPRESAGRESDLVGSDCCDRWMSVRDLLAVPSLGLRLLTTPDAMLLADRRSEVRAVAFAL